MPVAAFDFIREANLQGNVLNHYGFGGYLHHRGIKTFIDGRGELYRRRLHQAIRRDRERAERPVHSRQTLDEFHIDWTLLQKDLAANKILARLPNWKRVYSDERRHHLRPPALGPTCGAAIQVQECRSGAEASQLGVEAGAGIELAALLADLPADHGAALADFGGSITLAVIRPVSAGRKSSGSCDGERAGTVERAPHELRPDTALPVGVVGMRHVAGERIAGLRPGGAQHAQPVADRALARRRRCTG